MNQEIPTVIDKPIIVDWLAYLEPGCLVYLVKERKFAAIASHDFKDVKLPRFGRIQLQFAGNLTQTWTLSPNGTGFDGSQCLLPVVGHLRPTPELKSQVQSFLIKLK